MYNSKDLITDKDLTFLSYNQTVNCEFRLEDLIESPLWNVDTSNGLVKAIPLFNCDLITSSNPSDKVLDDNKCIICQNIYETLIKCTSNDTGSVHYYTVELYPYCPYTKLDVIDEVVVYCIVYDEFLNRLGNVDVDVYMDGTLTDTVKSDSNGICRFNVDQDCTVYFMYGSVESDEIVITGGD